MTNAQAPAQKPNAPAAGGLLSRVNRAPQPAPAPPPQPGSTSRFASTMNRNANPFGGNALTYEILPQSETLVCFSLEGLGGSLNYLMGDDGADSGGSYEAVLQIIEQDAKALDKLRRTLDEVWAAYELKGALLVYNWKPTTRDVIRASARLRNSRPIFLRAFDPLLVMNILARTRENLLQPRAPLAFDKSYLERALISDDLRLIRLVQTSGYFEETVQPLPEPVDDTETSDQ